jgi:hypothetical protein
MEAKEIRIVVPEYQHCVSDIGDIQHRETEIPQ